MLPKILRKFGYHIGCLSLIVACVFMSPVYAKKDDPAPPSMSIPSAQIMVANIAAQVPAVMRLVTATAYVIGIYFIFMGLLKLKQYGESRTMMSSDHSLSAPIIFLTVGALLLYLPTSVEVGLTTFWSSPSPYGYVSQSDQWGTFFNTIFVIIQLLGTISFIRGLIILAGMGGGHAQQGTLGRGLTHIIGGIFCINLYQFVQMILSTLGVQT